MARNQSDFTAEQRAAVVNAVLLDGMPTRAVADAAQAGTLDGVEAFTISRSSVSAFAREALAERNVEPGGHDSEIRKRLDALGLELLAMAEDVWANSKMLRVSATWGACVRSPACSRRSAARSRWDRAGSRRERNPAACSNGSPRKRRAPRPVTTTAATPKGAPVLEVLRSMYAMSYDGETVIDKRRAKLYAVRRRPPQGSRLVHVDSCRTARCLDVDHLTAELLIDPPPEPEHGRVWTRAIITAVRPPATPAQPWHATYESTKTRGDFPLNDRALKALGIAEGGTLALEHEVLLMEQHDKVGPTEVYPVPLDDEWLPNGFPGTAELAPTGWLKPTDPCVCLSGLSFVTCQGVPRPTSALLYA